MTTKKVCLVIDMVYDFVHEDGLFPRAFGEDAQPLIDLLPTIRTLLTTLSESTSIPIIECTSHYTVNQFHSKSLSTLCTTREGRESMLNELSSLFRLRIVKTLNSVFSLESSSEEEELLRLIKGSSVIVVGVTTSSCIQRSVESLVERGFNVIVPIDAISHRKSQNGRAQQVISKWRESDNVTVLDSWRDLL
jgi:nicotinamidase-related amidase